MLPLTLAQNFGSGESNPLEVAEHTFQRMDILNFPDELLSGLGDLHIVWGSTLLVVGALCVINGYKWHKWVVIACALLVGLGLGHVLSRQMGESRVVIGALGLLCAVVATPLLRFSVAIFAGLTGAFIGANAWTALSDSPEAHLAGAGMGFIALGMASFLLFRPVVVIFTAIGGASLAVLGGIALLLHVPSWEGAVRDSLTTNQMLIPLLVAVAAVTGVVLQTSSPGPKPAKPAESK